MRRGVRFYALLSIGAMVSANAAAQGAGWALPRLEPMTADNAAGALALRALPCPIGKRLPAQCELAFTPDGTRLVASSLRPEVRVFDLASGLAQQRIGTDGPMAIGIAISPDGRTLAIAAGAAVRLCDLGSGQLRGRLEGHEASVREVAFSPDGGILAEGGVDGYARLRQGRTGEVLRQLKAGEPIGDLSFSPDGRVLATASDDNRIRLWDPKTGDLLSTLQGHGD